MNRDELREKINELSSKQEWNHQYYLPYGLKTRQNDIDSPGYNINKWKRLEPILENMIHSDCKTFLDVGCSDGYYVIKAASLSENVEVKGIDLDPIRIERANFIKKLASSKNSSFEVVDLYDLMNQGKSFDVVMGLGLLHRVPDLDKCISDLCGLANSGVIFEFKSLNSNKSEVLNHGGVTKSNKLNGLYSTPSSLYVENKLREHSFRNITVFNDQSNLKYRRTIIVGNK